MVLITSACGDGSDEPACTHDLARAFASHIKQSMQVEEDSNNFWISSLAGHVRMNDYKRFGQISCLCAIFS